MTDDTATLLILGADAPGTSARAWRWGGPADGQSRLVVDFLESNADEIRRRYLAWVQELGDLVVDGKPLRTRFEFADGVNPWSLSVFVEQSPWRQLSVEPILKVMAIELLLEREPPARVRYEGSDRDLADILRNVCARRNMPFDATLLPARAAPPAASWRHRLPQSVQAFLGLVYLALTRVPLRKPTPAPDRTGRRIVICAPYFNNNGSEAGARDFESHFWTVLPALLESGGYQVTWLHSFYAHAATPDIGEARRQIRKLNDSRGAHGTHLLLQAFLTIGGFLKLAGRLCATAWRSRAGERVLSASVPYWPLMRADWAKAFRGAGCVENLLFSECFDRALKFLPRQDEGLYLMECQGWERALCHAWRRWGHGRLAGSVHSTIRYWDLRYHCDPRRYADAANRLPGPDVVVANGAAACRQYLSTCGPREPVVEGEAVRYLHLAKPSRAAAPAVARDALDVLVLGDYLPDNTDSLMRLVEEAGAGACAAIAVRVKAHPNSPVSPDRYPRLRVTVATGEVSALAGDADLVVSGNLTSAAVDAYVAGARVLVLDDGSRPNYSPLRGEPGVTFVRSAADLRAAIDASGSASAVECARTDFFHTDMRLPRWRHYFGIEARESA